MDRSIIVIAGKDPTASDGGMDPTYAPTGGPPSAPATSPDRHFDRRRAAALDRTSSRYFSFWMLNLIFLCSLAAQRVPESRTMFRSFLLVMFVAIGGDRLTIFRRQAVQRGRPHQGAQLRQGGYRP
jgi:hypothetical protein